MASESITTPLRRYGTDRNLKIKSDKACHCGSSDLKIQAGKSQCAACGEERTLEIVGGTQ